MDIQRDQDELEEDRFLSDPAVQARLLEVHRGRAARCQRACLDNSAEEVDEDRGDDLRWEDRYDCISEPAEEDRGEESPCESGQEDLPGSQDDSETSSDEGDIMIELQMGRQSKLALVKKGASLENAMPNFRSRWS